MRRLMFCALVLGLSGHSIYADSKKVQTKQTQPAKGAEKEKRADQPEVYVQDSSLGEGVLVLSNQKDIPKSPDGLSDNLDILFTYGAKMVKYKGKIYWQAARKEDFVQAESLRLGIKAEDVKLLNCVQKGPKECDHTQSCQSGTTMGWCTLMYYPKGGYYYCGCKI